MSRVSPPSAARGTVWGFQIERQCCPLHPQAPTTTTNTVFTAPHRVPISNRSEPFSKGYQRAIAVNLWLLIAMTGAHVDEGAGGFVNCCGKCYDGRVEVVHCAAHTHSTHARVRRVGGAGSRGREVVPDRRRGWGSLEATDSLYGTAQAESLHLADESWFVSNIDWKANTGVSMY